MTGTLRSVSPLLWLVVVACWAGTFRAQVALAQKGDKPSVQTAEEFKALHGLSGSLYRASLDYWQGVLRSEIAKRETTERERLDSLGRAAAAEKSAWRHELEARAPTGSSAPSNERDLYLLSQALLALADVQPAVDAAIADNRQRSESWQRVRDRLKPFADELKTRTIRPDIRIFVALMLAQSELMLGSAVGARELLAPVVSAGNSLGVTSSANRVLAHLVLADAFFALFRYREARDQVLAAARVASSMPANEGELLRLIRMRLFWTHYRAGDYLASLAAFRESCESDSLAWQTSRSASEKSLFDEMGRLAGTVLMRAGDLQLLDEWSGDGKLGECRAVVLVSYVRNLAQTGRFAEAVQAFLDYTNIMSSHVAWPQLAIDIHAIAERDRPGIRDEDNRRVVAAAAASLERDGPWMRRYEGAPEEARRQEFVKTLVVPAATDFYEEAFRLDTIQSRAAQRRSSTGPSASLGDGSKRSLLAAAAGLYETRLHEADAFADRPRVLLRLALTLSGLDRLEAALERSNAAIDGGLGGEERRSAFELRCELAKRMAWQDRAVPRITFWVERCGELVRSYPSGRSLGMLLDAVRD